MYKVPFERFDGSRGDWIFWSVDYTDQEFVEEARSMKKRELLQAIYEDSEGELSSEEIYEEAERLLIKYSDEQLLAEYSCFKV